MINYFLLCVHFPAYYLATMVNVSTLYSLNARTTQFFQRHCPIIQAFLVYAKCAAAVHTIELLNNYEFFFPLACLRFICTGQILPQEVKNLGFFCLRQYCALFSLKIREEINHSQFSTKDFQIYTMNTRCKAWVKLKTH